jgi:hypothetical protein
MKLNTLAAVALTGLLAVSGDSPEAPYQPLMALNPSGGLDDTMSFYYGYGDFQAVRSGMGAMATGTKGSVDMPVDNGGEQVYSIFGFSVGETPFAVDGNLWWDGVIINALSIINTQVNDNEFTSVITLEKGSLQYIFEITATYTFPHDYVMFHVACTIPEGNTEEVRFYTISAANNGYDGTTETNAGSEPLFYESPLLAVGVQNTNNALEGDPSAINPNPSYFWAEMADSEVKWSGYLISRAWCATYEPGSCGEGDGDDIGWYTGQDWTNTINNETLTTEALQATFSVLFGATPGTFSTKFIFAYTGSEAIGVHDKVLAVLNSNFNAPAPILVDPAVTIALWIGTCTVQSHS